VKITGDLKMTKNTQFAKTNAVCKIYFNEIKRNNGMSRINEQQQRHEQFKKTE